MGKALGVFLCVTACFRVGFFNTENKQRARAAGVTSGTHTLSHFVEMVCVPGEHVHAGTAATYVNPGISVQYVSLHSRTSSIIVLFILDVYQING